LVCVKYVHPHLSHFIRANKHVRLKSSCVVFGYRTTWYLRANSQDFDPSKASLVDDSSNSERLARWRDGATAQKAAQRDPDGDGAGPDAAGEYAGDEDDKDDDGADDDEEDDEDEEENEEDLFR
jgi:hypothetical protein